MPTKPELLKDLHARSHSERMQQLVVLGRKARDDQALEAVLDSLQQGNAEERRFALQSCHGSRKNAFVLDSITDKSRRVRRYARCLVPALCTDEQALEALERTFAVHQHQPLLIGLRGRKRTAVIDAFADKLAAKNAPELGALLSFASRPCIERHLDLALKAPGGLFWSRLLVHHPQLAAKALLRMLEPIKAWPAPRLSPLISQASSTLVTRCPHEALELATRLIKLEAPEGRTMLRAVCVHIPLEAFTRMQALKTYPLDSAVLQPVVGQLGEARLRFIVHHHAHALADPTHDNERPRWLDRLPEQERSAVLETWANSIDYHPRWGLSLFDRLEEPQRRTTFARWAKCSRDRSGIITTNILTQLPPDLARLEALRHLEEVEALRSQPSARNAYCAFLHFDEARSYLSDYLGHPQPENRQAALGILLRTARDEHIEAALELCVARCNEPDPVMSTMLSSIANWPTGQIARPHEAQLDFLFRKVLDSSSTSRTTLGHIERIAIARFALSPSWSAQWLQTLLAERAFIQYAPWALSLQDIADNIERCAPVLHKLADAYIDHQPNHGLALAEHLGPHLTNLPAWRALLEPFLALDKPSPLAQRALGLLCRLDAPALRPRLPGIAAEWIKAPQKDRIDALLAVLNHAADALFSEALLEPLEQIQGTASPQRAVAILNIFSRVDAPRFERCLLQTTEALLKRDKIPELANVLSSLRPSVSLPEAFFEIIERTLHVVQDTTHANKLLNLLRHRDRPRFERLLPRLLELDESFALLSSLLPYLCHARQNLMAPLLKKATLSGRFSKPKALWPSLEQRHLHRFALPAQQDLAKVLDRTLKSKKTNMYTALSAINHRVDLPFAEAAPLVNLAWDDRGAIKEGVLRSLARLDAGQGLPVLLDALAGAHGRVAIYGLRKALSELSEDSALSHLMAAPLKRVTVAKEVVRLVGELRSEAAYQHLIDLSKRDLHRDVRIALLRALWDHLDKRPTWQVYARAVEDQDWVVATKLAEIPLGRLSDDGQRRLGHLFAALLTREEPQARLDMLRRAAYLPLQDVDRRFLLGCLELLGAARTEEVSAALTAILARAHKSDVPAITERIEVLLPTRANLKTILEQLTRSGSAKVLLPLRTSVLSILEQDQLLVPQQLKLAAQLEGLQAFAQRLETLEAKGLLHADAMPVAIQQLGRLAYGEPAGALSKTFHRSPQANLRRLAVVLIEKAATGDQGWTDALRGMLGVLQRDSSAMVAGAAQFVFPETT